MTERESLSRVVSEQIRGRILDGTLKPGEHRDDLASGGIDYATDGGQVDGFTTKIDEYKQQIIDGKITVPTAP